MGGVQFPPKEKKEMATTSTALSSAEVRAGAGLKDRHISKTAGIKPYKIDVGHRYVFEDFKCDPVTSLRIGGASAGTDNGVNQLMFPNLMVSQYNTETQTIIGPTVDKGAGLLVSLDLTENDGVEYNFAGANAAQGEALRSKLAFVIGTDAFFAKLRFKVADVSGSDECAFGFRGVEAYAVLDDYDDFAVLNKIGGDIKIETALDDAATTTTDTTDNFADGDTKTFAVFVDKGGNVRYEIDGKAPTMTAKFQFNSGDTVIPFFLLLHDATTPGAVHFLEFECGLMEAEVR